VISPEREHEFVIYRTALGLHRSPTTKPQSNGEKRQIAILLWRRGDFDGFRLMNPMMQKIQIIKSAYVSSLRDK
jgi:hypothetical protein